MKRIMKDGFPSEPERARCLLREFDVYRQTDGPDTPWAIKITLKGYLLVDPKADVCGGSVGEGLERWQAKAIT